MAQRAIRYEFLITSGAITDEADKLYETGADLKAIASSAIAAGLHGY